MKTHRKNNCIKILDYIKKHGSITSDKARSIGVRRCAARIFDLRDMGTNIITTMIHSDNDRFAVYSIGAK